MSKIFLLFTFLGFLIPISVVAQEDQFLMQVEAEILSSEECQSAILQNEEDIILSILFIQGEVSGSTFHQESMVVSWEGNICTADLRIVPDKGWVREGGKIFSQKKWGCSATFEDPKFNEAGEPSCGSVLQEIKKEADFVSLALYSNGDIFLKEFHSGQTQIIEYLGSVRSRVPWWYYVGYFIILLVCFPTIAYLFSRSRKLAKKKDLSPKAPAKEEEKK